MVIRNCIFEKSYLFFTILGSFHTKWTKIFNISRGYLSNFFKFLPLTSIYET